MFLVGLVDRGCDRLVGTKRNAVIHCGNGHGMALRKRPGGRDNFRPVQLRRYRIAGAGQSDLHLGAMRVGKLNEEPLLYALPDFLLGHP